MPAFLSTALSRIMAGFGITVLLIATSYSCGRHDGVKAEKARVEARLEKARQVDQAAKSKAADQRVVDTQTVAKHEQELSRADDALPDAKPSAARTALACQRLRAQGTRPSELPAQCRSPG